MCVRSSSTMYMRTLTRNTLMSSAGPISMLVSKARRLEVCQTSNFNLQSGGRMMAAVATCRNDS